MHENHPEITQIKEVEDLKVLVRQLTGADGDKEHLCFKRGVLIL
jgi:hypothetical protein